jgi:hypothetical protein
MLTHFVINRIYPQSNLVPNPSFEQNVGCPTSNGQILLATPRVKVGGDGVIPYYNNCGALGFQAQSNHVGFQASRTGEGSAAITLLWGNHCISFYAESNFIGTPLSNPLTNGLKYRVRFYLSLTDYHRYASRNVGAYFSIGQPPDNTPYLLSLIPHVRYSGDFLNPLCY